MGQILKIKQLSEHYPDMIRYVGMEWNGMHHQVHCLPILFGRLRIRKTNREDIKEGSLLLFSCAERTPHLVSIFITVRRSARGQQQQAHTWRWKTFPFIRETDRDFERGFFSHAHRFQTPRYSFTFCFKLSENIKIISISPHPTPYRPPPPSSPQNKREGNVLVFLILVD